MTRKLKGLSGVLDHLSSPPPPLKKEVSEPVKSEKQPEPAPQPEPVKKEKTVATVPVRTGRPPGSGKKRVRKAKATVYINVNVMNRYREWSWVRRAQLGNLIEEALVDFYQRQHKKTNGS